MSVQPAAPQVPKSPPGQLGAVPAPDAAPAQGPGSGPASAQERSADRSAFQPFDRPAPLLDLSGVLDRKSGGKLPPLRDPFGGAVQQPPGEVPPLSPEIQQHVDERLAVWPEGSPERADLERAFASPGFAALEEGEQRRLVSFISGQNPISTAARPAVVRAVDAGATPEQLRELLASQPGLPPVVSGLPAAGEPARLPYTISGPTEVDATFASGPARAQRYDVEIAGQTIPVFVSLAVEPQDGHRHSLEEVAKGLAALPDSSRALIQQVHVDGKRNPSDSYWEQVYGQPGFRSYMTAGASGVVDIYPTVSPQAQHALDASLIHETGHILSGRAWGNWQSDPRWQAWDAASAADGLSPSTYARSSRAEDFSEALTLYQLSRGTSAEAEYRAMFPERFRFLDALLAAPPPTR